MQGLAFEFLTLLGSALVSPSAPALETGTCRPAALVRAELASQGMQPIIVGNRTGYGYPTSLIFFANADGSRGVLVRGDKPLGQQADIACIDSVYHDVRLNDVSVPGIPAWAKMGTRRSVAEAICARDHLGWQERCIEHDGGLISMEQAGQHVVFMATGTAINPRDNSMRAGQRIVVTLKPDEGGIVIASTPEGASYILSAYTSVSLTQHGKAMLR